MLTQEDWPSVMYDAMRFTSKWAAFYFIIVMTIGNYILFNLLVAILVEGFSNDPVSIFSSFVPIYVFLTYSQENSASFL